jgi:hypothetical protein
MISIDLCTFYRHYETCSHIVNSCLFFSKLKYRLHTCMSILIHNPLQQNGCKWCILLPACCEWISRMENNFPLSTFDVYGDSCMGTSSVTLGEHFKDGSEAITNPSHHGRPRSTTTTGYFLPRKESVNAVHYMNTLQKLLCAICDKHPWRDIPSFNMIMHTITLHAWNQGKSKSLAGKCFPILPTVQTWFLQTTTCSRP